MKKNIVAIIPARMGSSRFPGKPLKKIRGIPMIAHCYFRTSLCNDIKSTYVATCDTEIHEYINSIGGNSIMTSSSHERATDRTAEAMLKIEDQLGEKIDIVVMVQGDEPMVTPEMISKSIEPFSDERINVVNLMSPISTLKEFEDPNEVKVVCDNNGNAIYFSREAIPSRKKGIKDVPMYKQVCIIPFKRDYLIRFNKLEETELEKIESIDMLRILENNEAVKMIQIQEITYSVDTDDDRNRVEQAMKEDSLIDTYLQKL